MHELKSASRDEIAALEASGVPAQVRLLVDAYNNAGRIIFPAEWEERQIPAIILVHDSDGASSRVVVGDHPDEELQAFLKLGAKDPDGPVPPITRPTKDRPLLKKGTPGYIAHLESLLMNTALRVATYFELQDAEGLMSLEAEGPAHAN